jgi:general secretion pathway protein K
MVRRYRHASDGRQRGIALITALLVVAVAVIAAAAMLVTHNVAVHRSSNLRFVEQAWWYGAGVENWVAEILMQDKQSGDEDVDHLGEPWATSVENLPIEGGAIRGQVFDQQRCFNLNNLVGDLAEPAGEQLQRLLGLLENSDPYNAPALVQSIRDWIDEDANPQIPGGAEDSIYTGFDPPYRAPNRLMESVTELLLVNGMTPELYQALSPYVCVLPESGTRINVNTAPGLVLASLAHGVSAEDGEKLAEKRGTGYYKTTQEFRAETTYSGKTVDERLISVNSSYFLLTGEIQVGNGRVNLYSLLQRGPDGIRLLAHSKDSY